MKNITTKQPIKRHESLKQLSRDHHFGLLLCWKIRQGLNKSIDLNRITAYSDYFFTNFLLPHFEVEEKIVFPLLGNDHSLVKMALSDHQELKRLFNKKDLTQEQLIEAAILLERHIRFEERQLFNELQRCVSESDLMRIQSLHEHSVDETWNDEFWK